MALSITELKKGTIFQIGQEPYRVIDYNQKVMGRGGSIVNVKIKSLTSGRVLAKTFKGNEQVEEADILNTDAQFLYSDKDKLYFMDTANFEQYGVSISLLGEQKNFLKEGSLVKLQLYGGSVIGVDMPKNVYLKVAYAEDAVKGDTTSTLTKNAQLETGVKIKVPAFIKTGDIISVDTGTGNYRARKK